MVIIALDIGDIGLFLPQYVLDAGEHLPGLVPVALRAPT